MLTVNEATDEQLLFEILKREFNKKGKFITTVDESPDIEDQNIVYVRAGGQCCDLIFSRDCWRELRKRNSNISGS